MDWAVDAELSVDAGIHTDDDDGGLAAAGLQKKCLKKRCLWHRLLKVRTLRPVDAVVIVDAAGTDAAGTRIIAAAEHDAAGTRIIAVADDGVWQTTPTVFGWRSN